MNKIKLYTPDNLLGKLARCLVAVVLALALCPGFSYATTQSEPSVESTTAQEEQASTENSTTTDKSTDTNDENLSDTADDSKSATADGSDLNSEQSTGNEAPISVDNSELLGSTLSSSMSNSVYTASEKDSNNQLEPGTYTITANLSMPGEYNPVLPNVTVYANSPNNPSGINGTDHCVYDGNDPATVKDGIPNTPESMNATLIVGTDGTRTLILPVKNPVFTTQSVGTCAELPNVQVERKLPTDPSEWTYGSANTRISKMKVQLTDSENSGTVTYNFKGAVMYAVPLDKTIEPTGDIALQLAVDYSSMQKQNESTDIPAFQAGSNSPDMKSSSSGDSGNSDTKENSNTGGNSGNSNSGNKNTSNNSGTSKSDHVKAGTYTVTCNIWLSKADSGLPLSPHLNSSVFPPKDPQQNNAKLVVDSNGRGLVTVPIGIQSKVMSVNAISGLDIVSSTRSGGYLTSITVDVGILRSTSTVVTKSCSATITMGPLASIISGISGQHTWGATFQMQFSGLPGSGGGTLTPEQLAIIAGYEGVDSTASAEDAALAALSDETANGQNGLGGSSEQSGALEEVAQAVTSNLWLIAVVAAVLAAIAGGTYWFTTHRQNGK